MKELTGIDEIYTLFEKRYELSKLAKESGLDETEFNKLSTRDRFVTLSYKLKDSSRVHLSSFFFGKLFELSQDIEALLNKIDCLIILGEFEEAFRFNCIGFELYLEDHGIDSSEVEKVLCYQKAIIYFSSERLEAAESVCEENIIKFDQKESFVLLCAIFVAMKEYQKAIRVFTRYSHKFTDSYDFLTDVSILLLTINKNDKCSEFIVKLYDKDDSAKTKISTYLNNFYATTKNKEMLKKYFKDEFASVKICNT